MNKKLKRAKADSSTKRNKYHLILIMILIIVCCVTAIYSCTKLYDYKVDELPTSLQEIKISINKDNNKTSNNELEEKNSIENLNVNNKTEDKELITNKDSTIAKSVISSCKEVFVKKGDTLSSIFKKQGLDYKHLHRILNSHPQNSRLKKVMPGDIICISKDNKGDLLELKYKFDKQNSLHITRDEKNKIISKILEHDYEIKIKYKTVTIKNSLFQDAKKAGISDQLIMNLTKIFSWDIDFALDIRPGDTAHILYEEEYLDNKKIGIRNIIAAEFISSGKTYTALKYIDHENNFGYYDKKGISLRKAFIRTPVKFTRISSHFNLKRMHPILHKIRAHKGVDYAAPTGTPVKASGDGRVAFVGVKGGYGNAIILQHGKHYSTLYGHLSKFNPKLKKGTKVSQDQIIGYVGKTGLATAPHLHYEFRVDGVHKNPLTVKLPKANPIPKKEMEEFKEQANELLQILESHKKLQSKGLQNSD